ncbi:MAG TPA: ABC transporter ATP-binding protein [Acidimicrobiales bacterium]|nr:ABC transporter ATP-binding protein [Acidimicrobiales bacterium]
MSLLEMSALRAGYDGIPVLFGIDVRVEAGEVVALLGPNGAGKTSTLRAASGVIAAMAGTVRFDGRDLAGSPPEAVARMGLLHVPEGRGIFPSLEVGETLRLAASIAGVGRAKVVAALDEVYDTFPRLKERSTQTAGTLSGGEQQMLALARGLISRPKLLMVDEMSQGLAPTIVDQLFAIIAGFPARGVSVLLVEQFVGRALAVADRAYVLEKGEVSYDGDAATLAADESFVTGSYLGDIDVDVDVAAGHRVATRTTNGRPVAGSPIPALSEEVNVALPPALLRSLEDRAKVEGLDVAELVRRLVEDSAAGRA